MDKQLRKGLLEYCVLAVIEKEDSYGYKMIEDISPYIEISESTLYPILRRLEEAGRVRSYNTEHNNRIRKYFHITKEGREILKGFGKVREELMIVLDFIVGGRRDDEGNIS